MCHNQFADLRRFAAHAVKRLPLLQVHLLLGCSSHLQRPDIFISFIFMFTTFQSNRVFLLLVSHKKKVSGVKGSPIEINFFYRVSQKNDFLNFRWTGLSEQIRVFNPMCLSRCLFKYPAWRSDFRHWAQMCFSSLL